MTAFRGRIARLEINGQPFDIYPKHEHPPEHTTGAPPMTTTPDSTRAVVQRAEKFITTAFPGIDKAGPQWNDLVMTFVAGAMDTVVVSVDAADPDNEALAEEQTRLVWGDIQKASEAYL